MMSITVTKLPRLEPPSDLWPWNENRHHVGGSPPTSFVNPWPSFQRVETGLWGVFKTRFARDKSRFAVSETVGEGEDERVGLVGLRRPDWGADVQSKDRFKVTWLGHAGFLIETPPVADATRGVRVLCDTVFSERTSPLSWLGPKRYTPAPCAVEDLPQIDVVVTSHSHYDHLDLFTVKSVWQRAVRENRNLLFLAGLGMRQWFEGLGIGTPPGYGQVMEMDWWDGVDVSVDGVGTARIWATPSQHFSGRTPTDRDHTLWCSYVVAETPVEGGPGLTKAGRTTKKVFFAGDTGYRSVGPPPSSTGPHSGPGAVDDVSKTPGYVDESALPICPGFSTIGQLLGPFDLSLLPIGLCTPRWFMAPVHCNPHDSICVHKDLKSRRSIGMHWGTVKGGLSGAYEDVRWPPREWERAAKKGGYKWRKSGTGKPTRGEQSEEQEEENWEVGLMDVGETITA